MTMRNVSIQKLRKEENFKRRIAYFLSKQRLDITVYMVNIEKHHLLLYAKYECDSKQIIERLLSNYLKKTVFLKKDIDLLNE